MVSTLHSGFRALALLSALLLASCAHAPPRYPVSLLVLNDRADTIALFRSDRTGRFATATPGASCFALRDLPAHAVAIGLRPLAASRAIWTDEQLLSAREGWLLRISYDPTATSLSLRPYAPCREFGASSRAGAAS